MPMVDAFNTDTFGTVSLTDTVLKAPYKPSTIGRMGLFEPHPVSTTTTVVEEKAGQLGLIQTTRRGEPSDVGKPLKRTTRPFLIPHITLEDTIAAESIQNIRAYGSETELQSLIAEVNDRLMQLRQNHEVTLEWHRLGALKGLLLDADSTEIFNFFTEFNVIQTIVEFNLDVDGTEVLLKVLEVKRAVEAALGADRGLYDHIHCFCDSTFFDALTTHPLVKTAYERWNDGRFLRSDMRMGFEYGSTGVVFEEYTGTVSGTAFMGVGEAIFFPVGSPGLFKCHFAPADFMETVNTRGKELYAKQAPDPSGLNRYVKLHTQQNPLCICNRPAVLIKGWKNTATYS